MLEDLVIDEFAISLVSSGLDSTAQQLLLSHSVTSFGKNLVPLANSGQALMPLQARAGLRQGEVHLLGTDFICTFSTACSIWAVSPPLNVTPGGSVPA